MAAIRQIDKGYIREEVLQNSESEARFHENGDLRIPNIENQGQLVYRAQDKGFSQCASPGARINTVQYLGIAADEPERIERHIKPNVILPLVLLGWDEAYCRHWCKENDLLSPMMINKTNETTEQQTVFSAQTDGLKSVMLRAIIQMENEYEFV